MRAPALSPAAKTARPQFESLIEPRFGWTRYTSGAGSVWFRGYVHARAVQQVAAEAGRLTEDTAAAWLDGLDGHYSIVVEQPGWALAASDPVRSYPLVWIRDDDTVLVTHDGPALEQRLGLGPANIDPVMACAVALSGFTIGAATLYSTVRQIGPGEYLWLDAGGASQRRYHQWDPWRPNDVEPTDLVEPLSVLNRKLIDDLIAGAKGRPILVPLSAGLDSRFVASGLKEAGYDKVRCVSYGLAGNREAVTSRAIARRLGYDWTFVPYTQRAMRRAFQDPDYGRYKAYSDSLTGMHFPQEYGMLTVMLAEHGLDRDTVVVNGQAGDFIAGNHVPKALFHTGGDPAGRLDRIVAAFIAKHFKHWAVLQTPERLSEVDALIRAEIDKLGGLPDDPTGDHGIYEYCEFQDRQSKYVLNGQRIYEYLGLDWRLPLWDRAYMDFWARAPLSAKKGEALYRDVLHRDNWGGVWQDIPVNPTRIRPGWMRPLRFFAKALHAPLGRERWHRFEKRYLDYWMAATCAYAAWPYWRVAHDRRGHYSAFIWHVADYLESKGLRWDGARPSTTNG
jgi:asparagine synthase (glutamine-hydrolysing)